MSKGFAWLALIAMCLTFFRGLLAWAESAPLLAVIVGGVIVYALIQIAVEAAEGANES